MNDQQLATYLMTKDLREDDFFRKTSLDILVNKKDMMTKLEHIGKMNHELDRESEFNFIDRSDKKTYNAKIEGSVKRKAENNERIRQQLFAPAPRLIEPVHTPEPEFNDLPRF